jgi:hypothetical protein
MTLLKRIVTASVLFVFLSVVVYVAICMVGGGISGAIAGTGAHSIQNAHDAGREAGAGFVRHNLRVILLSSTLISLASSLALSFSGVFPWCKKPIKPPPLSKS